MRLSQRNLDGVAGALAFHLCLYCAVAGCFGLGLYYLMQPTRLVNPGLAAYKPPPRTVLVPAVPPLQVEPEAITPAAMAEPAPQTVGASAPRLPEVEKAKVQMKAQSPRRARPVRGPQPENPTNYAYQPSFGDYRPMY